MYVPLLILKYLRRRKIAWVSLIAVMLCTAMVLVVISVMSGWLGMFRASFQGLSGDVIVRSVGQAGFPYYEEIARELEARDDIIAAVPTLETYGLVSIDRQIQDGVRVVGLPMDRIGLVNNFPKSLFLNSPDVSRADRAAEWRAKVEATADALVAEGIILPDGRDVYVRSRVQPVEQWAARDEAAPSFDLPWDPDDYRLRLAIDGPRPRNAPDPATYPGIIVGTGVIGIRTEDGVLNRWPGVEPGEPRPIKMLVLAPDLDGGALDVEQQKSEFTGWLVDNSKTGVSATDSNHVYLPFEVLQRQMRMHADPANVVYPGGYDAETGQPIGEPVALPARTHKLHLAVAEGVDPTSLTLAVRDIVEKVLARHPDTAADAARIRVETWDEQPFIGDFLRAVERERALVVSLFSLVSLVSVFLILCIFYMIVQEKTRDIGIVKSVGATPGGIALVFLGYGGAIGIVGGALGVLVGGLIVHYINGIHTAMGYVLGLQIWNSDTYLFDKIPNTIAPLEATIIFLAAVVSSVIGAVVPALRAAFLRPVEALRFE